jgi:hypothetical protein
MRTPCTSQPSTASSSGSRSRAISRRRGAASWPSPDVSEDPRAPDVVPVDPRAPGDTFCVRPTLAAARVASCRWPGAWRRARWRRRGAGRPCTPGQRVRRAARQPVGASRTPPTRRSQGGHARPLTVEQQIDRPCPGGAARPTAECPSCASWPTAPLAVLPGPWRRPRTPGERGSSGWSPRATGRGGLDAASGAPAALRGQWRRSPRRRESQGGAADGPRLRRSARRDVSVMGQWLNGPASSFFISQSLSASASAHKLQPN